MVGELIADRYELEELVGSGGMSSVYRAKDSLLERHVALKVMHEGGFRHVPLLDANDRPVGLVSMRDVIDFVVRIFAKEMATVPPDSSHFTPSSSEGA